MAVYGILGPFDIRVESWSQYAERLTAYFVANDIKDEDKKKAILTTVISANTYALLRTLVSPDSVTTKTLKELIDVLNTHFNPTPSRIISRFKFNSRNRQPGESIATYVAELRKLAEHCEFSTTLNDMLLDRLVCGIRDDTMQRKLLAEEKGLTLADAIKMVQAMETASLNTNVLNNPQHSAQMQVNQITKANPRFTKQSKKKPTSQTHVSPPQENRLNSPSTIPSPQGRIINGRFCAHPRYCIRCTSGEHKSSGCPYSLTTCALCGKQGHIAKACLHPPNNIPTKSMPIPKNSRPSTTHHINANPQQDDGHVDMIEYETMYHLSHYDVIHALSEDPNEAKVHDIPPPEIITCKVNGTPMDFELDTGSGHTVINETSFRTFACPVDITPYQGQLRSFTGGVLDILGQATVTVQFNDVTSKLPLLVVKGHGPNLCGRKWIYSGLNILTVLHHQGIHKLVDNRMSLESILEKHKDVFSPGLGCLKNVKAHLYMKKDVPPIFSKARSVPYARKHAVEDELRRMEQEGILERVAYSEYASPIVPVQKPGGAIRVCGDFKSTINPYLHVEQYPLPRAEDIFAKLAGCRYFSNLDLKEAYCQIELDHESQQYVVINTTIGLFRFKRLPFGIASASAIFQRIMEQVLQDMKMVSPFQDDVLLGGPTSREHLTCIDQVLTRLENAGLKLKPDKCHFCKPGLEFLGHYLDAQGLHPQENKMKAIMNAPPPTNVETLRSFLGLLNYYARFIPHNATTLAPLYLLLRKNIPWTWKKEQQNAFQEVKNILNRSKMLVHYDLKKDLILACDASPVGVGAVISHTIDGRDHPIAFASRSLTSAERNYSQLDREALAIYFGVKRFHDYLYGRRFTLLTDHQPLVTLLAANKPIPPLAAARLQRWALLLAAYSYDLKFRKGSLNVNADALSRSPLPLATDNTPLPEEYIFVLKEIASGPITVKQIEDATIDDSELQQVHHYMKKGWPTRYISPPYDAYYRRRSELSTINRILLMGNRVIIPKKYQSHILEDLHSSHQGIVKMKAVARARVWWTTIEGDIEHMVNTCHRCQEQMSLPTAQFSSWPETTFPHERVHADFAGPIQNKQLFITVDTYSKWIEVGITSSTSSEAAMKHLRDTISRFGLIRTLVTDNGTAFTSQEFAAFINHYGIRHICTAPHHPASNGSAERTVRTIKTSLKKLADDTSTEFPSHIKGTLQNHLVRILLNHRRTPTQNGKTPAELMLGRDILTTVDLCHPILTKTFQEERSQITKFDLNTMVFARNFGRGERWFKGRIIAHIGKMMYLVATDKGEIRRHQNQLRARESTSQTSLDPSLPHEDNIPRDFLMMPSTLQQHGIQHPVLHQPGLQQPVTQPARTEIAREAVTSNEETHEREVRADVPEDSERSSTSTRPKRTIVLPMRYRT